MHRAGGEVHVPISGATSRAGSLRPRIIVTAFESPSRAKRQVLVLIIGPKDNERVIAKVVNALSAVRYTAAA